MPSSMPGSVKIQLMHLPLSLEGQCVIKATAKASMPTWPADDMQEHMACQSDDMLRGVT